MAAPLILIVLGLALVAFAGRRRRHPRTPIRFLAALRFAWHMIAGLAGLIVFSAYMLAPRHVMPGQRIPRPKARRIVTRMTANTAKEIIR